MQNAIHIVLSPAERDTLIQLLDIATKAGGLRVAEATLKFCQMLQDKPPAQPDPASPLATCK